MKLLFPISTVPLSHSKEIKQEKLEQKRKKTMDDAIHGERKYDKYHRKDNKLD